MAKGRDTNYDQIKQGTLGYSWISKQTFLVYLSGTHICPKRLTLRWGRMLILQFDFILWSQNHN